MRFTLILSILCFTLNGQALAGFDWHRSSNVSFIDDDSHSIQSIAEAVCASSEKDKKPLIRKISTLRNLESYFAELDPENPLAACATRYNEAIKDLLKVVDINNENVCSDEKITAIEEFHRQFVSTAGDEESRKEAPKILKKFFMFYALQVSATCKRGVVRNLEQATLNEGKNTNSLKFNFGSDYLAREMKTLGNLFEDVHSFADVLLRWDSKKKPKDASKALIFDSVDELTGEPMKMIIVVKNSQRVLTVQQQCRNLYRPVYSKIILPVVRLADLGYSYKDAQIEEQEKGLNKNEIVRQWYQLAQFCELINPVKFLQSEKIKDSRESMVITQLEAAKYEQQAPTKIEAPIARVEFEPSGNSIKDLDELELVNSESGREQVKNIKLSTSAQKRQTKRAIVKCARAIKKAARGRLIFSSHAACALESTEDDDSPCNLKDTKLEDLMEDKFDENKLQALESDSNSMRKRRTVSAVFASMRSFVQFVLIGVVALILVVLNNTGKE